jgi:hypothetical protein
MDRVSVVAPATPERLTSVSVGRNGEALLMDFAWFVRYVLMAGRQFQDLSGARAAARIDAALDSGGPLELRKEDRDLFVACVGHKDFQFPIQPALLFVPYVDVFENAQLVTT